MQKTIFAFFLSLILPSFSPASEAVQTPQHKEGVFWKFTATQKNWDVQSSCDTAGSYEIVYKGSQFTVFDITDGKKQEISKDCGGAEIVRMVNFQDERKYVLFPLKPDGKWRAAYKFRPVGSKRDSERHVEYKVVALEKLEVPAGSFDAYKILGEAQAQRSQLTVTIHYAPEVASIVSYRYESSSGPVREIKLIGFGQGH